MSERYHRQGLLPSIGPQGQARLARARVSIVGCGALGCVAADWLARAGVGEITLIDRDVVELTNLQRQTLYDERCLGAPKAHAAAERLARVNSAIRIQARAADLNPDSIDVLLGTPSVVIDGADNFETRYLVNDWCVKHGVPFVHAGVIGIRGLVMAVIPGQTPCLRCLLDEPPPPGSQPTCETAGVLGPAVGLVASLQASRAMHLIVTGSVPPTLTEIDAWAGRTREADPARRREDCPCCVERRFDFLEGGRAGHTASLCGGGAIQVRPTTHGRALDLAELARRLSAIAPFSATAHVARGTISEPGGDIEITVFGDARAIIRGVKDEAAAKAAYAKYIGA